MTGLSDDDVYSGGAVRKRRLGWFLLILSCFVAVGSAPVFGAEDITPSRVLILHSYHPEYAWTQSLQRGLRDAFVNGDMPVEYVTEYMDAKRHAEPGLRDALADLYEVKYTARQPDVIVACDNDALEFLFNYRQRLCPNVPVVFCGVNVADYDPDMLADRPGYTGIIQQYDLRSTVDLILHLQPDVEDIVVVHDRTTTGLALRESMDLFAPDYADRVAFVFPDTGSGLSEAELLSYLWGLQPNTAVYFLGFFRDRFNHSLSVGHITSRMADAAPVPIYAPSQAFFGYGVLGGKLMSGEIHGRSAGERALRILRGEPVAAMPVGIESASRYMFDYRQLKRFNISEADLPPGSVIAFKPTSFFREHKFAIIGSIIAVGLLCVVTVALIINTLYRRRAEKRLTVSEEQYRLLTAHATDMLSRHDAAGIYTYVSPACYNLFGYQPEELVGRKSYEFIHPDDINKVESTHDHLHNGEQRYTTVYRLRHKQGHYIWVETTSTLMREAGKPEAEDFVCVTRDITDRREIEEALREERQTLNRAQRVAHTGSWEYYPQTGRVVWSAEMFRMTGIDPVKGPPDLIEHRKFIHPDDLDQFEADMARAISVGGTAAFEFRVICPDGEIKHCLARYEAEQENGKTVRLLGTTQDVTEQKEAEAQREALETRLNQAHKMQAVGRLAGGMAHDFNNKLQSILGYTNLMLADIDQAHPFREELEVIREAANQSAELTRQLLAFARRQTIVPKVIDPNATIEGLLRMLQRLVGESIRIEWQPGEEIPPVRMDPSQVDQVLVNLVVNARDAIGSVGSITLRTSRVDIEEGDIGEVGNGGLPRGEYVLLSVSDTGEGIDAELLGKIFEPFFTTKERGKGTGLGLATVYGIVTQNGGSVLVDSQPGEGTTFRVYLPAVRDARVADKTTAEKTLDGVGGMGTILIVEDDAAILQLCKHMLEQLGYSILTAGGPQAAIELADSRLDEVDLLMTDVIMPEMSGRDLWQKLRQCRADLPCVFMSGYTSDMLAPDGVLEEGTLFVQKPFNIAELAEKVKQALARNDRPHNPI